MVRHTDQVFQFQAGDAGFFLNLTDGRDRDVLPRFLMAFWKVPFVASAYQQEVSATVGHKPSRSIHLFKCRAEFLIECLRISGRKVYVHQRSYSAEKRRKVLDATGPRMEFYRIRIGDSRVIFRAYCYTSVFQVYLVHRI